MNTKIKLKEDKYLMNKLSCCTKLIPILVDNKNVFCLKTPDFWSKIAKKCIDFNTELKSAANRVYYRQNGNIILECWYQVELLIKLIKRDNATPFYKFAELIDKIIDKCQITRFNVGSNLVRTECRRFEYDLRNCFHEIKREIIGNMEITVNFPEVITTSDMFQDIENKLEDEIEIIDMHLEFWNAINTATFLLTTNKLTDTALYGYEAEYTIFETLLERDEYIKSIIDMYNQKRQSTTKLRKILIDSKQYLEESYICLNQKSIKKN